MNRLRHRWVSLFFLLAMLAILVAGCSSREPRVVSTRVIPSPTPDPPVVPVGQSGKWNLIFRDEFNGTTLDDRKWNTCFWWDNGGCTIVTNSELEWYQPDNVTVGDGVLKLRAKPQTIPTAGGETYYYSSGMISSGRSTSDTSMPVKFSFLYGYAEARVKVPKGQGLWPAFWMLSDDNNSKPEIDVMEILGHDPATIQMHIHYSTQDQNDDSSGSSWTSHDFSTGWHTFAIDWQPKVVVWYVDGVERWRYTDVAHVPARPMYLLFNLAVGGEWPGSPDSTTQFPADYLIDYVRVWSSGTQTTLDPIDDAYVDASAPSANFGSDPFLVVDGDPISRVYLKFDSRSLAGKTLTSAILQMTTNSDSAAGSTGIQNVELVKDVKWTGMNITYANAPTPLPGVLGSLTDTSGNTTYYVPLKTPPLQSQIGNVFTLMLSSTNGDGLGLYSSRSEAGRPRLILNTSN